MTFLTDMLVYRYSLIASLRKQLGPLPVFDMVLWTFKLLHRRRSLFIVSAVFGGSLILGYISTFTS